MKPRQTRRCLLTGIGSTLVAVPLAGCSGGSGTDATASETDGTRESDAGSSDEPDYGGWFDGVDNDDSTVDRTDADEVTVSVGARSNGYQFDPPAVAVSAGTTVVWEWTGNGAHNVVSEADEFESELTGEEGFTFEYTFEEAGIHRYYCNPHKGQGMKGAVVVGDEFPTLTGNVLRTGAVWAGAAVFGTVALLGVAAYRELFGGESLTA